MSWRDLGYNQFGTKTDPKNGAGFIQGQQFDATLDDMELNRMIRLRDLTSVPQGASGKIYWDNDNKKYKLWVNETAGFCDVIYTSTSTSTSSTSTSSTSTSTTSSSSSTSTT